MPTTLKMVSGSPTNMLKSPSTFVLRINDCVNICGIYTFPDIRSTNIENSQERYTPNELCMYVCVCVFVQGIRKRSLSPHTLVVPL